MKVLDKLSPPGLSGCLSLLLSIFTLLLTSLNSLPAISANYQKEITEHSNSSCRKSSSFLKKKLREAADAYCLPYAGVQNYGDDTIYQYGSILSRRCKIISTVTCNQPIPTPIPSTNGQALVIGMSINCRSCQADAELIKDLLKKQDVDVTLTINPTSKEVLAYLDKAQQSLNSGERFVFYFSGHGGQVADTNGDEDDGNDEVLVLKDRELLDDELYGKFSQFKEGVKMLFLSDSCNSGTVYKSAHGNSDFYSEESKNLDNAFPGKFVAITSSRDDQQSAMGDPYSYFTTILHKTWDDGTFTGNIKQFYQEIYKQSLIQETQYRAFGIDVESFELERPFSSVEEPK